MTWALAGVLMIAGACKWLSIAVALLIGTVGAVLVFKGDPREVEVCMRGGASNVAENLMMVGMAVWMVAFSGSVMPGAM